MISSVPSRRLPLLLSLSVGFLTACATGGNDTVSTADSQSALPAGITLIETFEGDDSGISIPYTKYQLDNGLTVVLHEDDSDPLVHVDVTYHVGSNREEVGRSGFAHFFEHMMFQGSENVGDEQHFKIVSNAGGTLNGTTNSDRTNYFETVPANQLETALWLEADRMGFLLPAVTQEKFEVQRETVKNERGQRVDNQPYGRAFETLSKALYPEGHPYSWPVIGWIEDLNSANLDDLKRFFLRWYGPNNAVLTIGGDIEPMETLALVSQYFGSIPTGPDVENLPKQPAVVDRDRYITLEDNIHLPALAMIVPTVYSSHPDEPAIDAAAQILGQGQASLLYKRLVQTGRAVQANVNHSCSELACAMFYIVVQNPGSGETLAEMEQAVRDTIDEFGERGVNEDDLQKFKAGYESSRVFGLQSVSGKVSTLAYYETFTGSPAGISEEIARYLAVSTDDVVRVFNKYLKNKPAVLLSIVPMGKTDMAALEPNFVSPERNIPEVFTDSGSELALRIPEDDFDRSAQPQPELNRAVTLPTVNDVNLDNGVRVLAVNNNETPTTTINMYFDMGQRDEPMGKAGLAELTGAMMAEATTERSAGDFAEALERLGASVSVNTGIYETTVSLNTLTKNLDAAIALMEERILKPAFKGEDFERIKKNTLEGLQQARVTPQVLAQRARLAIAFGPEHPLSYLTSGSTETVAELSLEDVKGFYSTHLPTHLSGIVVSSDLSTSDILSSLGNMGQLSVNESRRSALSGIRDMTGQTVYLVDKDEAAQSTVQTIHRSLPYDALGDYHLAGLMNFTLGGTFNSRINLNLREDKGYTYGARTTFSGGREFGSFGFSAEVNKDATAASVTEVINELQSYRTDGMSEEEYSYMVSAISQRDALQYETPGRKLGLLAQMLRYDLPSDYRNTQQALLRKTPRAKLNELAARLIQPDNMAIVIVGDADAITDELKALGMDVVRVSEDGHIMK